MYSIFALIAAIDLVGILLSAVVGWRIGTTRAPEQALLGVSLFSIIITVTLLVAIQASPLKGPLVVQETLLFCFSIAAALIGGCGVGIAKRQRRKAGINVVGIGAIILIALMQARFFNRIHDTLEAARSAGLFETRVAYEPQKNKECPENLKSLYIAFQQYAQDWDALPPATNWEENDDLISKVSQNEWLHCPAVSNRHDDKYGYSYNDAVAGRKLNGKSRLADLPDAARTPLLYDSTNLSKSAHDAVSSLPRPGRHSGRDNILYLDGHVDAIVPK